MPHPLRTLLGSRSLEVAARVLLTFPFWGSGLHKVTHLDETQALMATSGLQPAAAFAAATIAVQLGGSALVISGRLTWLGAGALGIFTALTIPIVHRFWAMDGEAARVAFYTATEHVGVIGGLVAIAILAARPRPATVPDAVAIPRTVTLAR